MNPSTCIVLSSHIVVVKVFHHISRSFLLFYAFPQSFLSCPKRCGVGRATRLGRAFPFVRPVLASSVVLLASRTHNNITTPFHLNEPFSLRDFPCWGFQGIRQGFPPTTNAPPQIMLCKIQQEINAQSVEDCVQTKLLQLFKNRNRTCHQCPIAQTPYTSLSSAFQDCQAPVSFWKAR